jgi:hypothetical protein
MASCGLWSARRRLVAVVMDDEGRASPAIVVAPNDDARWGLLERLDAVHGLDCQLILPEELAKADSIARLAITRGIVVWVAPQRLVEAIRAAAALATGPPARTAAMIGRLPLVPSWRGHLRRLGQQHDRRQLPLF